MKEGGIYIHIPFCRNKCLYCDFYSGGARIADWENYIGSVVNELKCREEELRFEPVTLYIGGGTPSLIPLKNLEDLLNGISEISGINKWKELTLEVNPEDVTRELCHEWRQMGIDRISMGLQSLNDEELRLIGRRHDSKTGIRALNLLKEEFDNISVDLMFGLPGQTSMSYEKTLERIISLRPTHLSAYSLMLESGTAMTILADKGRITLPGEDEWIEMFRITQDKSKEGGYRRYEISNYSFPGYESHHNGNYWNGSPYIGLGPGAHSYDGERIRRANPQDIKGYVKFYKEYEKKENLFFEEEVLTENELQEEMIMTRLRTVKGLNLHEYEELFGKEKKNILLQEASDFIDQGQMEENNGYLRFADRGFLISDIILSRLI